MTIVLGLLPIVLLVKGIHSVYFLINVYKDLKNYKNSKQGVLYNVSYGDDCPVITVEYMVDDTPCYIDKKVTEKELKKIQKCGVLTLLFNDYFEDVLIENKRIRRVSNELFIAIACFSFLTVCWPMVFLLLVPFLG